MQVDSPQLFTPFPLNYGAYQYRRKSARYLLPQELSAVLCCSSLNRAVPLVHVIQQPHSSVVTSYNPFDLR